MYGLVVEAPEFARLEYCGLKAALHLAAAWALDDEMIAITDRIVRAVIDVTQHASLRLEPNEHSPRKLPTFFSGKSSQIFAGSGKETPVIRFDNLLGILERQRAVGGSNATTQRYVVGLRLGFDRLLPDLTDVPKVSVRPYLGDDWGDVDGSCNASELGQA